MSHQDKHPHSGQYAWKYSSTAKGIAVMLDTTEHAVYQLLGRALRKLRKFEEVKDD